MASKRKIEANTNWLGPATVFPTDVDAAEGQPELLVPYDSTKNIHKLDALNLTGVNGGRYRPQFAIKAEKVSKKE